MSHVRADLSHPTRVPRAARVIFGFAPRVAFPLRVSPPPRAVAPADLRRLREGAPGVHRLHRAEHRILGQPRRRYARSHRPRLISAHARPSFETRVNESLTRPRKRHLGTSTTRALKTRRSNASRARSLLSTLLSRTTTVRASDAKTERVALIDSDVAEAEALVRRMDLEARSMQNPGEGADERQAPRVQNRAGALEARRGDSGEAASSARSDRAQLLAGAELDDMHAPTSHGQRERCCTARAAGSDGRPHPRGQARAAGH